MSANTNLCAGDVAERIHRATRIADRQVVAVITSECAAAQVAGVSWYDTRPMLDPREQSDMLVDEHREILAHALDRRLVVAHPHEPHLVRLAVGPAA